MQGRRLHRSGAGRVRAFVRRFIAPATAAAMLLRAAGAGAASYLPGTPEADPPTGATGRVEEGSAPITGNGIQWRLAPLRHAGSVSLDGRWLRLEDGRSATQSLIFNDIDFATYVWQPWFIQLRAGLGTLGARDRSADADGSVQTSTSAALTGRFTMAVFPTSRFPFELRNEVSDSRVRGDSYGTDYRTHRFSLSQAYRPPTGNDSYSLQFERSRLQASNGAEDTLSSLRATALRQFSEHSFDLTGQLTVNERSDTDDSSRLALLSARHTFHPASALHVDTLATWNDVEFRSGTGDQRIVSASDIRQLSSFATWRPREGDWLYSASSPLYLSGSMRVVDAGSESDSGDEARLRALNASLGASQELTREWRLNGSLSGTLLQSQGRDRSATATGNGSLTYTPQGLSFGDWRYTPSLGAGIGASRSSEAGLRHSLSGQATHGASRSYALGANDSVTVNVTQSLSALRESQATALTRALAHSAGVWWQGSGAASQSHAGLSFSDSRTWAQEDGSFQLINLQLSQRSQLTRQSSWSGNLTLQASRSERSLIDAVTGLEQQSGTGWQRMAIGSLSYENQRLWGVPRLRYTALLAVNSQQLESRALGDFDAPRERITESLENRLDYSIGRLEARLTARLARVDGRSVASIFARVQRHY
ncbi:MAG: hypothetical protein OEY03_03605 [Rhizobacter sp.]|nr:hypothetical protein [Rhizobacter sp.]